MPPPRNSDGARLDDSAETPETDAGPPKGRAAPERRCIATQASYPPVGMIRFVRSPDGVVTPDLAARLPGRGAWVLATREALETAMRKGAFARAFKAQVQMPADLADTVERLLARRLLDALGLATRAGEMVTGFDRVRDAVRAARPACLLEASDGAADGRAKVVGLSRAIWGPDRDASGGDDPDEDEQDEDEDDGGAAFVAENQAETPVEPPVLDCFTADELAMALGRDRVIHACLKQGRLAQRVLGDFARLTGFRRATSDPRDTQTRRMGTTPDPDPAGSAGADPGADAGPQTTRGPGREPGLTEPN